MNRTALTVLSVLLLAAGASAELVVNGGFELPLDVGWQDTIHDLGGEYRIEQSDTLGQPQPGLAVEVYKYLADFASLYQVIDIPSTDLVLEFDGRFSINGGSSTCWPVASFWVRYLNAAGTELGSSRFYLPSEFCDWASSPTVSLVRITQAGAWEHHRLDIADELSTRLTGINPADVNKVCLDLYAYDSGT